MGGVPSNPLIAGPEQKVISSMPLPKPSRLDACDHRLHVQIQIESLPQAGIQEGHRDAAGVGEVIWVQNGG